MVDQDLVNKTVPILVAVGVVALIIVAYVVCAKSKLCRHQTTKKLQEEGADGNVCHPSFF